MRWIVLLAVLFGLGWTAYLGVQQLDKAVLITDYWPVQRGEHAWQLVNYVEGKAKLYAFNSTQGYGEIFLGLWPVWALFLLLFLIFTPLTMYLYQGANDAQITTAKEAKQNAEQQAQKAQRDAQTHQQTITRWAEERVAVAQQEQQRLARKELEKEWQAYHHQKAQLLDREATIQQKERAAQQMEASAKERIDTITQQYQQEKARFETELSQMAKARDNAQAGQQRLKKERQQIHDFLEQAQWSINNEALTYPTLKRLSKRKQP